MESNIMEIIKPDILSRADIEKLVDAFYEKVKADGQIGYLFTEVAKVDWTHHLPRMYDFWESVVFQTNTFTGNPMIPHFQLNRQSPLSRAHFKRWIQLFSETTDDYFKGANAELAKKRAISIASIMELKISAQGDNG